MSYFQITIVVLDHWTASNKLLGKHTSNVHNAVLVHNRSVVSRGGPQANRRTAGAPPTEPHIPASTHNTASKTHRGRTWKVNTAMSRGLVVAHEQLGPLPVLPPAPLPLPLPLKCTDLPSSRLAPPPPLSPTYTTLFRSGFDTQCRLYVPSDLLFSDEKYKRARSDASTRGRHHIG